MDSNPHKKDSISLEEFSSISEKGKKSDSNLLYKDLNPGFGELKNTW